MNLKTIAHAIECLSIPFELTTVQREIVEELSQFKCVGLFMDVGTGKTVISTILANFYNNQVNIVIVPHILIRDWEAWIHRVDPSADVLIYYGPRRAIHPARWIITSHAVFRSDFKLLLQKLLCHSMTIILDEAHAIKNFRSVLGKQIKSLSIVNHTILLTGTPTSKPDDAYQYISIKTPGIYRSFFHFQDTHAEEIDRSGAVSKWRDLERLKINLGLQARFVSKRKYSET